jgi:hypothetical protein
MGDSIEGDTIHMKDQGWRAKSWNRTMLWPRWLNIKDPSQKWLSLDNSHTLFLLSFEFTNTEGISHRVYSWQEKEDRMLEKYKPVIGGMTDSHSIQIHKDSGTLTVPRTPKNTTYLNLSWLIAPMVSLHGSQADSLIYPCFHANY